MREQFIPIVFCIDNKCVFPACVAACSIIKSKKADTNYSFYFLLAEEVNGTSREQITRLEQIFPKESFQLVEGHSEWLRDAKLGEAGFHLTSAAYFRLFIADILVDMEKCIYLDMDVLVLGDLGEMFETDISEYYIAGVRDYALTTEGCEERKEMLGIPDLNCYINSGVLLLNLQKIREDGLVEQWKSEMTKGYPFGDQDVLNKTCYGKIKRLDLKYNLINRYYHNPDMFTKAIYTTDEIAVATNMPLIMHFVGRNKPWLFDKSKGSDAWQRVAQQFMNSLEKEEYAFKRKEYAQLYNWKEFLSRSGSRIIIWGFTSIGKLLFEMLKKSGKKIVAFGDNALDKEGIVYQQTKVVSKANLSEFSYDSIIVASQKAFNSICAELVETGLDKMSVIPYIQKTKEYYMAIRMEYYDEELQDIYYKEFGNENPQINSINYMDFFAERYDDIGAKYYFSVWLEKQ